MYSVRKNVSKLLTTCTLVLLCSAMVFANTVRYVDPINGSDSDNGTTTSLAWATISKALTWVAANKGSYGDIEIRLMEGYHVISSTLEITNSHTDNDSLIIRANGTDEPVICGGKRVTGTWTTHSGSIMKVPFSHNGKVRQIYVNGVARNFSKGGSFSNAGNYESGGTKLGLTTSDGDAAVFDNPSHVELWYDKPNDCSGMYATYCIGVDSIWGSSTKTFKMKQPVWHDTRTIESGQSGSCVRTDLDETF